MMSKKNLVELDDELLYLQKKSLEGKKEPPPTLKEKQIKEIAYTIGRCPDTQLFVLYEIIFNPKTKVVESLKEIYRDVYFSEVEIQFKVNVANNVFEKVRNS